MLAPPWERQKNASPPLNDAKNDKWRPRNKYNLPYHIENISTWKTDGSSDVNGKFHILYVFFKPCFMLLPIKFTGIAWSHYNNCLALNPILFWK